MSDPVLRGYVTPRLIGGQRISQSVQNTVIRSYAGQHGLAYRLSATEFTDGDHPMLRQLMAEEDTSGIIMFSLLALPQDRSARAGAIQMSLDAGKALHGASEGFVIRDADGAERWEDAMLVRELVGPR